MTLLRQWAQAEKALDDAKASGNHDAVRTLVPTVNALRRQVRDLRIVGDSPNDKLGSRYRVSMIALPTWM